MSVKASLMSASSALVLALLNQASAVQAADAASDPLCAVSGLNGKAEMIGGYAEVNDEGNGGLIGGLGSLSMPLGCDFGLQLDAGVINEINQTTYGGAAHLFMRNPDSYLLGVTGGYFEAGSVNIWAAGPEVEIYAGPVSVEAWAGFADIDSGNDFFAVVDAAIYPIDDLRLSAGASMIGDKDFLRAALEYQFASPIAASLAAKVGEDDYFSATASLKFYFGSSDKSLMRRHREDDPDNVIMEVIGYSDKDAVSNGTGTGTGTLPPTTS